MGGGGGSNYKGGLDLLIVPDYIYFLLIFFKNSSWKWINFVSKGGSSEPPKYPLDPSLLLIIIKHITLWHTVKTGLAAVYSIPELLRKYDQTQL